MLVCLITSGKTGTAVRAIKMVDVDSVGHEHSKTMNSMLKEMY
jgi:hypothetical protein